MAISALLSIMTIVIFSIFSHTSSQLYSQDFSDYTISSISPISESLTAPTLPPLSPSVPAFFIIGDSSVDCGNNNFLGTLARADRLPYGRDFDTHQPTGRFCNGRIPVDYLGNIVFLDFPLVHSPYFLLNYLNGW